MLVVKYHESNCNDKNILVAIDKAINSSIQLRSKKELIEDFIESVNISTKSMKTGVNLYMNRKKRILQRSLMKNG